MNIYDPKNLAIINQEMKNKFAYNNDLQIPKVNKVVVGVGIGQALINPKFKEVTEKTLQVITGQKPAWRLARKAIAGFKLRKGVVIGWQVTLRGQRLKDFISRLVNIVLPRIRDFRGLSASAFDGKGNYNIGIREQGVFPEIKYNEVELIHGIGITIVTSAKTDEQAKELLTLMGFPFKSNEQRVSPPLSS